MSVRIFIAISEVNDGKIRPFPAYPKILRALIHIIKFYDM